MKVAHLTTVDLSLRFLVFPQLKAILQGGGEAVGISAPGPWVEVVEAEGIRHVPLKSSTRRVDWRADLGAIAELWRVLRRERPDVLHTHNPKPGVYGRILGRLAGVPIVVNTVHGFYAAPDDPLIKRLIVYLLEAVASRFSDAELFQNPEDLALARRWRITPRSRSFLLGNGVDLTRFAPGRFVEEDRAEVRAELGAGDDQVVVGIVGRLVAEKGYPELFEAVAALGPQYLLVVAGPDDPTKPDALPREMIEEAAGAGVRFLGMRHDVDRLYAGMDLFVLPSHREGFPRAAMEAAAMGLPVVATDIRGCRQVVDDGVTGMLVPVRDPPALAEAISTLGENEELRRRMGEASREKALASFDERRVVSIVLETQRAAAVSKGLTWDIALPSHSASASVRPATRADAPAVARLHQAEIGSGFLSSLGPGFLTVLYEGLIDFPQAEVLVAVDSNDQVLGFVAGVADTGAFYRSFLRSRFLTAAVGSGHRLLRPSTVRQALETLRYGLDEQSDAPAAELLAMAVSASGRGHGLGRRLGEDLLDWFAGRGVDRARVVVGADNEAAIGLYRRLGFSEPVPMAIHSGSPSLSLTWPA